MHESNITVELVQKLIDEQFPEYSKLDIKALKNNGIDNRTFRLGQEMLVRLPSALGYASQVKKEQKWLPFFQDKLSIQIPVPIAMGQPSKFYPWNWSIYKWLNGQSANIMGNIPLNLNEIAETLAEFLIEFQKINTHDGPVAGIHNYYRGAHPSVYKDEALLTFSPTQRKVRMSK